MIIPKKSRQEAFEDLRSDYSAAKFGRFRRRRQVPHSGSGADYHYRTETDFLRIMEYARDMERNDAIAGPLVNQAVMNIVQNGLTPDPKTGDPGVDTAIKEYWSAWSSDAQQCSLDGELVYRDIEKIALRRMLVDGDIFPALTEGGQIELVEAHRCRSPVRTSMNVVHGVLMDDSRRRLQYWFTRDEVQPWQLVTRVSEIEKREVFDEDGYRVILHLRNPARPTQTRGISGFSPVFDLMGMHEDLHFAKLVQQQVASCIAFLRQRDANYDGNVPAPLGRQTEEIFDAQKRIIQELAPGIEIRGVKGETITGFSPNIPNAEFFQQMRTILQLIGVNFGIPLVLMMLDASDTNFSGWRGAMDSARLGFKDMQQLLVDHLECPVYLWKIRQWAKSDKALRAALEKKSAGISGNQKIFNHEWHAPRWPYIQPLQDAQADQLKQQALLVSPRRIHGANGGDWDQTIDETVDDNGNAILKAAKKAKDISSEIGERVGWREVLFLTDANMLKAVTAATPVAPAGEPDSGPQPLNGVQVTAAVDLIGKIRGGTVAPEAAREILVAIGMSEESAAAAIKATPVNDGKGDADKQFFRDLLKAFALNPSTMALLVNSVKVGDVVDGAAIPRNGEYDEPYVNVPALPGAEITGDTQKDSEGAIIGAAVKPVASDGADGAVAQGELANAIGTFVRAGVLTPQTEDENFVRKAANLPPMSRDVEEQWAEDGGVRRPITLQNSDGSHPASKPAAPGDNAPPNQDPEGGKDKPDPEDDTQDPEDKKDAS